MTATAWAEVETRPRLLFGRMHEDAAIEASAFAGRRRVLCIASAGCTALYLAGRGHTVLAVDRNPAQIAYLRRRMSGGSAEVGDVDRLLAAGRGTLAIAGWTRAALAAFLGLRNRAVQRAMWRERFEPALRAALMLVLRPTALRWAYGPALAAAAPADLGPALLRRLRRGFSLHRNADNPYAWRLFGQPVADPPTTLPVSAIEPVLGDMAAVIAAQPPGSVGGFALSNIFDGADAGYRGLLAAALRRAATRDAVVVERSFAEPGDRAGADGAARDRSLLWGAVTVTPAASWS